ncbi:MAG: YbhB/YbcL family Raf kinase inhibitor-like protein [Acidimicrobiales bacterium]
MRSVLAACAVALVLAGCGDEGQELRAPSPDQTTTSASTTSTSAAASSTTDVAAGTGGGSGGSAASPTTVTTLRLTSPAFGDGRPIPAEYTCVGDDVSPPLTWTGVPAGTAELALVVRDPDADGFVHWVISRLPPDVGGLARGNPPSQAVEALNDFGRQGWSGPCPPSGTHTYDFRIYALAEPSGIAAGADGPQAAEQLESAAVLASAALGGTAAAP